MRSIIDKTFGHCPVGIEDIIEVEERCGGESHVAGEEAEVWDHFRFQQRAGSPGSRWGMDSKS